VSRAPPAAEIVTQAIGVATSLLSKGKDQKTRETMNGIKTNLYAAAVQSLGKHVEDMGFRSGSWDPTGRASKI